MMVSRFARSLACVLVLAWGVGAPGAVPGDGKKLSRLERQMRVALQREDADRVLALFAKLESIGSDAAEIILEAMLTIGTLSIYEEGLATLGKIGLEPLSPFFERMFDSNATAPEINTILMTVAGRAEEQGAEEWLIRGLSHPQSMVQRCCIRHLRERRSKEAIPHLITILEEEGIDRNTVSFESRRALIDLTGRDFPVAEDWRKFWESQKDTIDPRQSPQDDEGTSVPRVTVADAPTEFFGVNIVSERVAFVIDISASMQKYDEAPGESGSGADWTQRQRIERVKKELVRAVSRLSPRARFNITAFNDRIYPFQKKLVPATPAWKKRAYRFISRLVADRGTHTDEAMESVFQDRAFDTLVLLSDGAPHSPRGRPRELIPVVIDLVRDLNRIRHVRIYTFGFDGTGKWPPGSRYGHNPRARAADPTLLTEFLRRLAAENDGEYTSLQ